MKPEAKTHEKAKEEDTRKGTIVSQYRVQKAIAALITYEGQTIVFLDDTNLWGLTSVSIPNSPCPFALAFQVTSSAQLEWGGSWLKKVGEIKLVTEYVNNSILDVDRNWNCNLERPTVEENSRPALFGVSRVAVVFSGWIQQNLLDKLEIYTVRKNIAVTDMSTNETVFYYN